MTDDDTDYVRMWYDGEDYLSDVDSSDEEGNMKGPGKEIADDIIRTNGIHWTKDQLKKFRKFTSDFMFNFNNFSDVDFKAWLDKKTEDARNENETWLGRAIDSVSNYFGLISSHDTLWSAVTGYPSTADESYDLASQLFVTKYLNQAEEQSKTVNRQFRVKQYQSMNKNF